MIQFESERQAVLAMLNRAKPKNIARFRLSECSRSLNKGNLVAAVGVLGQQVSVHVSHNDYSRNVWIYGRNGVLCWEGRDDVLRDRIVALYRA